MNYKPDESTIISWLYGELGEKEKQKLDLYFKDHPDELQRVKGMADTRDIFRRMKDKEVIAPPIFMDSSSIRPLWQSPVMKVTLGIAASFLLLMIAAKLIGMEINYGSGELRIGFGTKQSVPVQTVQTGLTSEAVQSMINTSLVKNNEVISSDWNDNQKKLDASIRQRLDVNSRKMDDIVKQASVASQEQVRTFVAGLQNDNLRLMKDYLQLSSVEQKKYVETLLVDFSKYLQEQRNQDLNLFQTRITSVEANTNQFKQETEHILSSIISNSSVPQKQNNY